ncbi:MAG TPA: peptide ABC transporter ATP-binding protein [Candidatus Omnitrophica bacterium]|nr:peptide ABC transporter ATP-binding protein [Candidatus Omnitrophota bacterium]HBQ38511.1 peptide ABC transporter ATP-binding protein [Candidatus Omnitrophota bacterium]
MALLSVEHLSVSYRHRDTLVRAVDDVSFVIEAGEVLALVGESGSGKSSVALALARLLPPRAVISGRAALKETSLLDASEETLRAIRGGTIAYVFQDPATSLNPVMTIGAQLLEAIVWHTPAGHEEARRLAVWWLRQVGIPMPELRLRAYPHQLSGGMQQRVCLAMALAARPSLLVADEPTTALDVTIQVQILRLLRDLQRRLNLSVLLISHDLTVVERIAHRVGVMSGGRLAESGAVDQVLHRPAHAATQALLRARSAMSFKT